MIRVLIVDDLPETREHLARLLSFDSEIVLAGSAGSGEDAVRKAVELRPDVVLIDIDLPGMDGITATTMISEQATNPQVITMSLKGDADIIKRAMLAGAREFLIKPFSADELTTSIRNVYDKEQARRAKMAVPVVGAPPPGNGVAAPPTQNRLICVFSPKGGAGRTTIAVNLAVALQQETRMRVCLMDANFQFGDIGVLMNLNPRTRSIADVIEAGDPDRDIVDSVLVNHPRGVRVMLAPPSPETAELISATHLRKIIGFLRETHDYVVVDLPATINEQALAIMDAADTIVVLAGLEITSIKNVRLFLELADQVNYAREKLRLIVNRSDASHGIRITDMEGSIRRPLDGTIVSDWRLTEHAVNRGVPFVVSHPEAGISRDVVKLAVSLTDAEAHAPAPAPKPAKRGLFARR